MIICKPLGLLFLLFVTNASGQNLTQIVRCNDCGGREYRLQAFVKIAPQDTTLVTLGNWQSAKPIQKITRQPGGWYAYEQTGKIRRGASKIAVFIHWNRKIEELRIDCANLQTKRNGKWENTGIINTDFETQLPTEQTDTATGWVNYSFYALERDSTMAYTGKSSLLAKRTDMALYGDNPDAGRMVTVNSIRLYYETYGNGPPVLLLHGNNESISSFAHQIHELRKTHRVIAVDSRGQGKSTMDRKKMTYELMAADMKLFLESLRIESAHIVGWSDGGNTGLVMSMRYPEKVKSLVTMGANLFPGRKAVEKRFWREIVWTTRLVSIVKLFNPKRWMQKYRVAKMVLKEPRIKPAWLQSVSVPVLVVAGEKDVILQKHTELIASQLKKSRLVILPAASHYAPSEKPEDFNRVMKAFLTEYP